MASTEVPAAEFKDLFLSAAFTPFELPTVEQVVQAITTAFAGDERLTVLPYRGSGLGLYRVVLSRPEYLKKFYAARDARKAEQIRTKVVSDSTLRLAETVGLRADVLCMSGGGVGHLAKAVRDDPAMPEMGVVAVVTGGNDYVGARYESHNELYLRWIRVSKS